MLFGVTLGDGKLVEQRTQTFDALPMLALDQLANAAFALVQQAAERVKIARRSPRRDPYR